ncbi:F-box/kelch-repeat protein At3g23880-like [Ipomoea triloba]|uniref:F-box/kelch-repeat protein At3g23880-like n=1 Tax=Ipomoea triloba TaxID=35885 RepID=UPI00125D6A26|nr:F-box/kelch-repeat protein At3g23880-like [Ipomoea triloba]
MSMLSLASNRHKAWLAMISSPDFVETHLDLHKNDEEDNLAMFYTTGDGLHLSLFSILINLSFSNRQPIHIPNMSMLSRASNSQKVSSLPRSPLSHLPQDLIFSGVLPKLPVKPLMRFQCVSKGWLAMISSPDFAKSNLDTHKNDEEDKLATFSATDDGLHLSLFPIVVEENQYPTNCSSLKVPEVALRYMGAHNGLLCFQGIDHKVVVCNPCTGKIKKINGPSWPTIWMYGFGYDQQNRDYKVVYARRTQSSNDYDILVYSFRSGGWEKTPHGFSAGIVNPNGVHLNGTLNWSSSIMVGRDDWEFKIVSFNLTTNSAAILSAPNPERSRNISICESRGFLLASFFHTEKVSVWQMREFGVEKSWTKLACVVELLPKSLHKTAMLTVAVICNSVSLVYAMNNRNLIIKVGEHLRIYTPEEGKSKRIIEVCRPGNRGFKAILFRETLAPPPCLSDDEDDVV